MTHIGRSLDNAANPAIGTAAGSGAPAVGVPPRRRDLDRLRVLACLSTFVFHSLAVFDFNPYYHLKSNTPAVAADVASRLLHVVRMPLFFLIAGMVSFMVLGRGTPQQQMRQRAMRLLPPFLVGIVLFTPFIKYLELADGRNINWRGIFPSAGAPDPLVFALRYFTQLKWFSWAHMWFPLYLFLLGIALLPAMQAIARMRWQPGRHVFVLLTLPLAAVVAIELLLRPFFPVHIPNLFWDWANVAVYVVVMLAGAALVRWPVLEAELQRRVPVMALAGALGVALFLAFGNSPLHHIGRALTLWGCLGVLVGIGPWIARGPRLATESYLSEAALPLYVLHHLPVAVIAFYVKDLPWPVWERYAVIVLGAFVVAFAAYHVLVRPFDPVRRAMGMPARRGVDPVRTPAASPGAANELRP